MKEIISRHKTYLIVMTALAVLTAAGVVLSLSTGFCDFWTDSVYPLICGFGTLVTGRLPFALGEILMYLAALMATGVVVIWVAAIFLRKRQRYMAFACGYLRSFLCITMAVLLIYTTNWLIPYRSSVMGKPGKTYSEEYDVEQLRAVYYFIVDELNECCREVPRDENGNVIYHSKSETERLVGEGMNSLSGEFPRMGGKCPPIKTALCSDLLEWMYIGGYTYPYSFETTANKYMSRLYFPSLYAHETAHHLGYYKEHEANFAAFLACTASDDPVIRYAGYDDIYYYIMNDYCMAIDSLEDYELYEKLYEEFETHCVDEQVYADEQEQHEAADALYEEDSHPLEDYSDTAEDIGDVGWETQGDIIEASSFDYDDVTVLVMDYFKGRLY